MAFQRLNIRAKKSFPGLYSFDNVESSPAKSMAMHIDSSPRSDLTQDLEECDLEEFGAKLERCKGKDSPGRESPSKRKKLFGSLRSLRSLANLHSSPTKTKQATTPRPESSVKYRDTCATSLPMSPSLALLNFEQSPPDKPMFDLTMHQRSGSGSSLEVHHSSPMTVPGSARQATPYNIFPPATDLPAGTVPVTPGPMQRAFNRDPANHVLWQNASPTPLERYAPSTPVLTPLPGTNLSVEDIDPELVPLPPSVNPSIVYLSHSNPGYFDIPVDENPQMDSTDVLNGLACLKLADAHDGTAGDYSKAFADAGVDAPVGRRGTAEEMRHQYGDAKVQDTVNTLVIPQGRLRTHGRQQGAREPQENVRGFPKHHQELPLRLKQEDGGLQDSVRQDSCISEDWETCSGARSAAMTSVHSLHNRDLNQPCMSSSSSIYAGDGKGNDVENDMTPKFAYIVWDSPDGPRRGLAPEKIWGRHSGLYDGSGYGEDSGPSTPREPEEGIQGELKASSAPLSVCGARFGKENSNGPSRGEDPFPGAVSESPLATHEQGNCESLESIYRAYAYPFGDRIPSSSNNSVGGDVQRLETKDGQISP
ncbi:uncharacterized protein M421DRAFT_1653 [Didymella exigua CBS 183.55]|uniref:Uncharacterized protein n=1 Tax=Didymella exigua CBS 183.55 TaxID=1150837 RepID=A0A6A5RZR5_9PLEO|nr:uncharacterized protein M421DRAFT_1653 [Didymella exigua CBS 183.55]KAF1933093.1 hypothetical protein M421DRAFT_1653 [Didymella exigua CBS 183.55]